MNFRSLTLAAFLIKKENAVLSIHQNDVVEFPFSEELGEKPEEMLRRALHNRASIQSIRSIRHIIE